MQYALAQSCQAAQAVRIVQITQQRRDARRAQGCPPRRLRGERQHPYTRREQAGHTQAHVTAADNEHTAAPKACR
jgi:hypothetical protein